MDTDNDWTPQLPSYLGQLCIHNMQTVNNTI